MPPDLPRALEPPGGHPLAIALVTAVATRAPARILLVGIGSGRHIPLFLAANVAVDAFDDDATRVAAARRRFATEPRVRVAHGSYLEPAPFDTTYDGALATHALLHGRASDARAAVAATHARLLDGGAFHATLGSTRDPRFARGRRIDDETFAPLDGDERGVPHVFFDRAGARTAFAPFDLEALDEADAAGTVGRWAHEEPAPGSIVHWFVRARRARAAS